MCEVRLELSENARSHTRRIRIRLLLLLLRRARHRRVSVRHVRIHSVCTHDDMRGAVWWRRCTARVGGMMAAARMNEFAFE